METQPHDIVPPLQPSTNGRTINFLSTAKERDFRYKAYERLKRKRSNDPATYYSGGLDSEEIFWIGILSPKEIRDNLAGPHKISFLPSGMSGYTEDGFIKRHNDGTPVESEEPKGQVLGHYLYQLPDDLLRFLKEHRNGGLGCFHMLLREVVRDDGMRWVWLLKCESAEIYTRWGLYLPTVWYNQTAGQMRWATEFTITAAHEQVPILVEKPYQWLK